MSVITSQPTRGARHLYNLLKYLPDANHLKHRNHKITGFRTLTGLAIDEFSHRLRATTDAYNATVEPRFRIRTVATTFFVSFAPGTWLSGPEKVAIAQEIGEAIAWDRFGVECWHENIITGAADYNLVVPTVAIDGVPVLRRVRSENLMGAARRAADRAVAILNAARAASGRPPIKTPADSRLKDPRLFMVERKLAEDASKRGHIKVGAKHLPSLLHASGMAEAWRSMDLRMRLRFARPKPKKPTANEVVSVSIQELLRLVNHFLGLIKFKAKNKTNNKNEVSNYSKNESKNHTKTQNTGGDLKQDHHRGTPSTKSDGPQKDR